MTVALLTEPSPAPPSDLGPYRREDYLALEDEPRCELLFGRFYLSPSPSPLHQDAVFTLARQLERIARKSGGKVFVAPLDVVLADHTVVQPDVIYLTAERRHLVEERIEGAPDLVAEVVSPSTARRDRGEKLRVYAASGVREVWLVDPFARQVEFFANLDGRLVLALPEGPVYESRALPEIRLDLAAFWAEVATP